MHSNLFIIYELKVIEFGTAVAFETKSSYCRVAPGRGGGGALGYFLDGYVPPGAPKWHPVPKRNFP